MSLNDALSADAQDVAQAGAKPDAVYTVVVSSGVTSSGLTLDSVEWEDVLSGGTALSNTVSSGGQATVESGGLTSGDVVMADGSEIVSAGGVASNVTVSSGGLISGAGLIDSGTIYGFAAGLRVGPTHEFDTYVNIASGGVASALDILSAGIVTVSAGGSALAARLEAGANLSVLSGGLASSTVVSRGGFLEVEGEADATTLLSGAYAHVDGVISSGATTAQMSGVAVSKGAYLEVDSAAEVTSARIYQGGSAQIEDGGASSSSTVNGGALTVGYGGSISFTTLAGGGSVTVLDGAVDYFDHVVSGTLDIEPFGVAAEPMVASGGVLIDNGFIETSEEFISTAKDVLAGQLSGSGTLIQVSGGVLELDGDATAFTGLVDIAGGSVEVATSSGLVGGSVYFDQYYASGSACTLKIDAANQPATGVLYGAVLSDFNSSADRIDLAGLAFVSGATAKVHGHVLTVTDGAYTVSFTLADSWAKQFVVASDGAGGTLIHPRVGATVVSSAAHAAGAAASPLIVDGSQTKPDGVYTLVISSGVTSSGLTLDSVEWEDVLSGGTALSNTVSSGGQVTVEAGGLTESDVVSANGTEIVSAGGSALNATVSSGGLISGGGLIDSATVYGFAVGLRVARTKGIDGQVLIEPGGVASALKTASGSELDVDSGGSATATQVAGGFVVFSGGVASNSTISSGGVAIVEGTADATTLLSGSYVHVNADANPSSGTTALAGMMSGVTVSNGAYLEAGSGGQVEGARILQGGSVQVQQDGQFQSSTVSGGAVTVGYEGAVSAITVADGGSMTVLPGATDALARIVSGALSLGEFAVDLEPSVSSGGVLIDNGIVETGTALSGPAKDVLAGQLSGSGLIIQEGGLLQLDGNASAFAGQVVITGGTVEVATAQGLVAGSVEFASGAASTLKLDSAAQPATGALYGAVLSDFNSSADRIDLAGLAFVSGATAKVHGHVLTVTDGAYTVSFTLADSWAKQFVVASDGAGGTLIHPRVGATVVSSAAHAAGAAASPLIVDGSRTKPDVAYTVVISSGVTSSGLTLDSIEWEDVLSGGTALSNTVSSGGQATVESGGLTSGDVVIVNGAEIVSAGGVASSVTVSSGGLISGAGLIDSGAIYGFAAGLLIGPTHDFEAFTMVASGGVASALDVINGGVLQTSAGGSATATKVEDGGYLEAFSGGVLSNSTISSGGGLEVEGEADATTLLSGSYAHVAAQPNYGSALSATSALLDGAVVSKGAYLEVASGGVAEDVKIYRGASAQIEAYGLMSSSVINGGAATLGFSGSGTALTVTAGGSLTLLGGSTEIGTHITSGTLDILPFGIVAEPIVSSGGVLIDNGFAQFEAGVVPGVTRDVLAGQLSGSGTLIQVSAGVLELDGDASAFTGQVNIAGGTVEVATAEGLVSGSVYFDQYYGSGAASTLKIDAANRPASGALYGPVLSDFNSSADRIDLAGLAYVSGATAKVHGDTLKVTDGAYTVSFTLADSWAEQLVVASDGAGGTLIHPRVGAATVSATVSLIQAAAGFAPAAAGPNPLSAYALQSARVELAPPGEAKRPLA